ncbi:depupylase/deamidase Dop [Aquipuribacter nitratireducens]|uniref:Depupylase/deamidase Dop n=1 Tax=Aquipuribacter nitratireducens TaxID=650104 RepID=A0ABW0GJM2_9MICO
MGIETEYGILAPGRPDQNPMVLSSQVVNAFATRPGSRVGRARWDYEDEAPLRDARGHDMSRAAAHPSQLTDVAASHGGAMPDLEDPATANVVLTNGARLYVDHAHPEYSSPEVTGPRAAVVWDKAGERVMQEAATRVGSTPGLGEVRLYKNNTDSKGASYGCHENYLVQRATPFADLVSGLVPFFVTRQVVTGAGRVSIGPDGSVPGYQISQRADFIEVEVGLETTLKRPIVNTRDEPHASADRYRRLHVILGDANLFETATFLKLGTTALVLDMVEAGTLPADLHLASPVRALHDISHDPTVQAKVRLADGREVTALDVQWAYLEAARAHTAEREPDDATAARETEEVLRRWEDVLTRLGRDPALCHRDVEWVAKLRLLDGFAAREGVTWGHPRLAAIDLQWADVRPDKGLYHRLVARGQVDRLVDDAEVARAVDEAPEDTRAWFRGQCLARYGSAVAAASWDSVIFDVPGRGALQRVPTPEPLRGTREHVGALLDASATARDLVDALTST